MNKPNMLIVGCCGSIGHEICKHYAETYNIIGIGIHKPVISMDWYECDIVNLATLESVCNVIMAKYESIDTIIYCSGISKPLDITEVNEEDWNLLYNVNVRGFEFVIHYLFPVIKKTPGMSIVQINSKSGKKGSKKNSIYASTKFAGIGLVQSLALELADYGVRVNCVCPGNVMASHTWQDVLFDKFSKQQNLTPEGVKAKYIGLVPLGRECYYSDIINAVDFLINKNSSYITGQAINVTGGQQLF